MKGANPDVRRVTRAVKRTDDGRNPGKGLAEKHGTGGRAACAEVCTWKLWKKASMLSARDRVRPDTRS